MKSGVLVFDMDGVLVDVTDSYRETIRRTVEHFSGQEIAQEKVQEYKNRGGWNNDWALSQKICKDLGFEVPYHRVIEHFQRLFLGPAGDGMDGLIVRERWIARDGLLAGLAARFQLAVFTGRPLHEACITLRRFAPEIRFDPMITDDDALPSKPEPDGLFRIRDLTGGLPMWYVGDTVDDARSGRSAGVPFIGITRHPSTIGLLQAEGAIAVLDDINQLPEVLK